MAVYVTVANCGCVHTRIVVNSYFCFFSCSSIPDSSTANATRRVVPATRVPRETNHDSAVFDDRKSAVTFPREREGILSGTSAESDGGTLENLSEDSQRKRGTNEPGREIN